MRTYQRGGTGGVWYLLTDEGKHVSLRTTDEREAQRNLSDYLNSLRDERKSTITVDEVVSLNRREWCRIKVMRGLRIHRCKHVVSLNLSLTP